MRRSLGFAFLLTLLLPLGASAQDSTRPLTIGDTFTLESETLGETRRINVYAPAVYQHSDTLRVPVLYMPDGGIEEDFLHVAGLVQILSLNGGMQPHLLVGIENTERRRDLTGPTNDPADREIADVVGGSAAFRTFIRDELMPVITERYRTTGAKAIVGESLAGLFVLETLLLEPELFDSYIAIDPSLWWDRERLVAEINQTLRGESASHSGRDLRVFLAASSQEGIVEPTRRLSGLLGDGVLPGIQVHYQEFPDEFHWTIYQPAALAAFRLVLAPRSAD